MTEEDFSRCKIAIVDSDNLFCQQLQACLRDADFQVEYERNALSGLKKIKSWKPHIVISDYVVHGMDYFDFAQQVEALPFKTHMIVVSSHYLDGPLISQLANISRVALTVQKPIKPQDLLNKIIDLIPQIDFSEQTEPPEPIDTESDYSLNDKDLQQEIARLQFEAKELPRFVASLKALTSLARQQPHKSQYLREALEQSKKTFEEVRRQRLPHLEEPIEQVTNLLAEIIDKGSLPSLKAWDQVQGELNTLSEPKNRIGTSTLPDFDSEETEELHSMADIQNLLPLPTNMIQTFRPKPRLPTFPHSPKFLVVGNDPGEELLNLGSRYGVSITIREQLEQVREACQAATFDLVLLLLPPNLSGERARETVVSMHESLRGLEMYNETPLVVLSDLESMHTRVVTAHLNNSHWLSWAELRRNENAFLNLKSIADRAGIRPSVLIVDSDISDSEELLRELSRRCSKVDTVREPDTVITVIQDCRPDVILVSEQIGDLSGLDLCRAINSCLSFDSITLILEVTSTDSGTLKGAFRAGIDGIIYKSDSKDLSAELVLKIWRRCYALRKSGEVFEKPSLEISADIRASVEQDLKRSIDEQRPLTLGVIDINDTELTGEDVARKWQLSQKETTTSAVHHIGQTRLLISVIGLRKSTVSKILQEMLEAVHQNTLGQPTNAFVFRCRSYPDDALNLSDLLGSF